MRCGEDELRLSDFRVNQLLILSKDIMNATGSSSRLSCAGRSAISSLGEEGNLFVGTAEIEV